MSLNERQCTVLLSYDSPYLKESDYQSNLESKDESVKISTLKTLISSLLQGDHYPKLLMSVIKFCLHSDNHVVKKLLLLYWEVVEKKSKEGVLLHEMILVCNALKNNITHANEYVRGSTLRFLCKIKEIEILESLIPSITDNLQHRHSYVRKNAVLTVFNVYSVHPELIPDAPELIEQFLYAETNPSAKKNAFLMLFHCSQDKAVTYLDSVIGTISNTGESFQLIALELIRKICKSNPTLKSVYIRAIYTLVNSPNNAVAYEAASTLVSLSSAPTAIRAAVTSYTSLLAAESENNIKLVILQRLTHLKNKNPKILQEMIMDLLRSLSSPNSEIRKQTLSLAQQLLTVRNVEDVISLLKKELSKLDSPSSSSSELLLANKAEHYDYRKQLLDFLHECAIKFPSTVRPISSMLMTYLADEAVQTALDVAYFLRELIEEYRDVREELLGKLIENFSEIKASEVFRVALWIVGEYAEGKEGVRKAIEGIKEAVGPLPIIEVQREEEEKRKEEEDRSKAKKAGPTVLSDGTYASQSAASSLVVAETSGGSAVRGLLVLGDFFLGACLAATMAKLTLRYGDQRETAQTLLLLVSLLRVGTVSQAVKPIDPDSQSRINLCIRILLDTNNPFNLDLFTLSNRQAFADMLADQRKKSAVALGKSSKVVKAQVDDLLSIRQLKGKSGNVIDDDTIDLDDADLHKAIGSPSSSVASDISSSLHRVHQLTGFADPIYAEAHVTVQSYDIVLDILLVNSSSSTLQNVTVELHTSGDLKVVERPAPHTIPAGGVVRVSSSIKLSSTESGIIFGNIVYDNSSGTVKNVVVLNNIHMDIEDYIGPAYVTDSNFRAMWAEFEWYTTRTHRDTLNRIQRAAVRVLGRPASTHRFPCYSPVYVLSRENKVAVSTDIPSLNDYLLHIIHITNMLCLTPPSTLQGEANFLAANLYARSMFGEDALLNVSVEKHKNGKIGGYLRIRSKTQGIALSLGDKITAKQKNNK